MKVTIRYRSGYKYLKMSNVGLPQGRLKGKGETEMEMEGEQKKKKKGKRKKEKKFPKVFGPCVGLREERWRDPCILRSSYMYIHVVTTSLSYRSCMKSKYTSWARESPATVHIVPIPDSCTRPDREECALEYLSRIDPIQPSRPWPWIQSPQIHQM
jgi:hypothetical protein